MKMKRGKRYQIVYQVDRLGKPRVIVADFMYATQRDYILSARPLAGTQTLPRTWIQSVVFVGSKIPIALPKDWHG